MAMVFAASAHWLTAIAATAVAAAVPVTIVDESVVPSAAGAVVPVAMNASEAAKTGAVTTTVHVWVAIVAAGFESFLVVIVYT